MKESVVIFINYNEVYNTIEKYGTISAYDIQYIFSMNIQGDYRNNMKCNEFGLDIRHIDIQKINLKPYS